MRLFIAAVICLVFFSCAPDLYTHDQVVNRYKNKDDLIKRFGIATYTRAAEGYEEWIYVFESGAVGMSMPLPGTNMDIMKVKKYDKRLTFLIDAQGLVRKCVADGVDLTERKSKRQG